MKQTPLEASYARLYEWVKSYFCSVVHAVLFLAIESWHQSCQLWLSNTSMRLLEWRVLHSLLLIGHLKMKSRTKGKEGVHKLWLIVTSFQGGGWARKNVASCILKLVFLLYLSYSLYMVFFVIDSILCSWVYFLLILSHYTIIQLHIYTTIYIQLHIYNYIYTITYTYNYIYMQLHIHITTYWMILKMCKVIGRGLVGLCDSAWQGGGGKLKCGWRHFEWPLMLVVNVKASAMFLNWSYAGTHSCHTSCS